MMQQAGQPSDAHQHQQSSRGMPKFSLLGHYAASPAHHGFSLLGALEQQPPQHFQPASAPPPNAFQNLLHQGFLLTTAGQQGYNLQLAPQMLQGIMEDLIKLSPPGSPPMEARGLPPYSLLSLLEHKTEQLQALVHSLSQASQHSGGIIQPHAAMAAARMASNISQIALATVGLPHLLPDPLPSQAPPPPPPPPSAPAGPPLLFSVATPSPPAAVRIPEPPLVVQQQAQQESEGVNEEGGESAGGSRGEEEEEGETEELAPGSYDLVEMNAVEILAEHTHFCDKCGKGFKRDANLRMHMRGHGEQYKSAAALARPAAERSSVQGPDAAPRPRRYSCPYAGCKRNKKHRKFQPLKTLLCVKNHYRRSHCPKSLTCAKCNTKKFSVVADLKTHEKHCGRDKWQCSCGTTFSRKDKLLGHIALFQGHSPATPLHDAAAPSAAAVAGADSNDEPVGGCC